MDILRMGSLPPLQTLFRVGPPLTHMLLRDAPPPRHLLALETLAPCLIVCYVGATRASMTSHGWEFEHTQMQHPDECLCVTYDAITHGSLKEHRLW